jgi:hypothetical protein
MLRLYPGAFRQSYGDELLRLFEDLLQDAREPGSRLGVLRLWTYIVVDLLTSVVNQRMEDPMNNHPVLTRLLILAVPVAALGALFAVGPAFGVSALALGMAAIALRWRSLGSALRGPGGGAWWLAPLFGLALMGAAAGVTHLPGRGDYIWALASLLFVIGGLTLVGSLLRSLYVYLRPLQAE